MSFTVIILPQAEREFQEFYDWIAARSRDGAATWAKAFLRALKSLESLESNPYGCSLAPESEDWPEEIRQLVFKTRRGNRYRALLVVRQSRVYVLHLRASGQDVMTADQIQGPDDG
jgi:plasmid stabilization system protein ParE